MTKNEGIAEGNRGFIIPIPLGESVLNASFGIYFPRFTGTIYEILSAPMSFGEILLGYIGAAATKSVIIGVIILSTAWFFVPIRIDHPFWMIFFLVITSVTFSLMGFIIGIWVIPPFLTEAKSRGLGS